MSYLFHLLLALGSLAAHELELGDGIERPWLLVVLLWVPPLLGLVLGRLLRRGRVAAAARLERLLVVSAPLGQLVAVLEAGWIPWIERQTGLPAALGDWSHLGMLLGIAPYLVLELTVLEVRLRLLGAPPGARRFQWRLLLSSLAPVVFYLALSTVVGSHAPLRVHLQTVALLELGWLLTLLSLFLLVLPGILVRAWGAVPLEAGWRRDVLEGLAARAGFRARALLRWPTGHQMANAAILGVTPRTRVVVFSDALLARLGPVELGAVFAHEMGHALRRHVLTFGAFTVSLFLAFDLVAARLTPTSEWLDLGLLVGMVVVWYVAFGWISRRFELEADLEARDLLGSGEGLVRALYTVSGAHAAERSSWRHFSTAVRARFLERVEHDPAPALRLRRRLRWISRTSLVAATLLFGHQVWTLAETWGPDRVVASLRLGEFDEARRRAADVELGEGLAAIVEATERLGDERDPAALADRARTALATGDLGRAWALLELAELRGFEPDANLWNELDRRRPRAEGEEGPPAMEVEDPAWRRALEAFDRRF